MTDSASNLPPAQTGAASDLPPAQAGAVPALLPLAAGRDGIRLRLLRPLPALTLRAYCRGIEVGHSTLAPGLAAGAEILLPVTRLPLVALPTELRFAAAPEGPDLAPPWPVAHAGAALALLGPPAAPEIEGLRLDQGMLRGVAVDRANGLIAPVMYARINALGARGVLVEPPWPLPEGGCAWRFSLAIEPGDLTESGLAVALHLVGVEAPVAHFAWARTAPEDAGPRIAALEARIAQLEAQAEAQTRRLAEEAARHAAALVERTDAFIETAAALLLDRLAGTASAAGAEDARLAGLRRLIADAAATPPPDTALLLGTRAEIPPAAGHLASGWHPPEQDEGGPFRWMGATALVVNPEPHRPVAAVRLLLRHHYGAEHAAVTARFDAHPARTDREQDAAGVTWLVLRPEGEEAVLCHGLRLASDHAGVPLRDGHSPDDRLLSIAVGLVAFDYAAESSARSDGSPLGPSERR